MDAKELIEYRTVHIDWDEDPPRHERRGCQASTSPGGPESADTEAEHRVRAAIAPYLAEGWEPDGELRAATSFATRERQVLLPTPGLVGPMWEEYVSAEVRLRRRTSVAGTGKA